MSAMKILQGQLRVGCCPIPVSIADLAANFGRRRVSREAIGVSLPQTKALISRIRPTGTGLYLDWESLLYGAPL